MANKVVIIGAGVNGLCLAEAFLRQGYEVEVYDQEGIPNTNGPSFLDVQIIRPHYVDQIGLGLRIQPALAAWRKLFSELGQNFFQPSGVVAISCKKGDWAERAMHVMRENSLPFRMIEGQMLEDLFPALKLDNMRMGILADLGGQIRGRELMYTLHKYLTERGVKFFPHYKVEGVSADDGAIFTQGGRKNADWIVVTSGFESLLPDFMIETREFMGAFLDVRPPPEIALYWRFAPIWVDLGNETNCWGIPNFGKGKLRLGAGVFSDKITHEDFEVQEDFESLYAGIIHDFSRYKTENFRRVRYKGYASGELILKRKENVLALVADSGHGFKFAAENAQSIVDGIENDSLTIAARHIAGV